MSKPDLSDASSEEDHSAEDSFKHNYDTLNLCVRAIKPQFA